MSNSVNHFVLGMRYLLSEEEFMLYAEDMAQLDERYQEAFKFLIMYGYGIEYAFANCANWYEAVTFSVTPLSFKDLYLMSKNMLGKLKAETIRINDSLTTTN